MKISLCIPTYKSSSFIVRSFEKVLNNENIDEIIIYDDGSDDFDILCTNINSLSCNKIKIFQSDINQKAFKNKYLCVKESKNEWVILLDSDNIIDNDYIDILLKQELRDDTLYCPEKALPNFIYSHLKNLDINANSYNYFDISFYLAFLNTGNYCFNKQEYIESLGL